MEAHGVSKEVTKEECSGSVRRRRKRAPWDGCRRVQNVEESSFLLLLLSFCWSHTSVHVTK